MSGVAERERYGWKLALAALLNVLLGPALLGIAVFVLLRVYPAKPAVVGLAAVLAFVVALLIVWTVLFFKFTQSRTVLRGIAYFLVLVCSSAAVISALVSLGLLNDKARRTEADAREVAQVRLVLAEGDKAVAVAIGEHGGTTDLHTGGNDEAGRIARAAKALLHATSDAERVSLDKLDRIHFPEFMAPASFKDDPGFERARKHISETRAAADEHERAMTGALSNYRAVVAGANIDAADRTAALKRLDAAIVAGARERAKKTSLMLKMLDEFDAQLQDLARARGKWHVEGLDVVFTDEAALARYREHAKAERAVFKEMQKTFGPTSATP